MPWQSIPITSKSDKARGELMSLEWLQNWYVAPGPEGGKSPFALYPTPGLVLFDTIGDGPIRGAHFMAPLLYVVSGDRLYSRNSSGTINNIGQIKGSGSVYITDNGTHLGIATSKQSYAANNSTVIELPEQNLNGATYQDGYGIFSQAGTEKFWISGLDDMTTINALDFSTADAFADTITGCISDHRELWLFGEKTIEVWYNAGVAAFPFVRAQSGFMETGCGAPGSIAKANNAVFWLGDDFQVYMATGYSPQAISNPQQDKWISERKDPSSARAFTYNQEGHDFYVLNFTDGTLVYDMTVGRWHERKSLDADRWRANCHTEAFDKQLVGDYQNGNIYYLDLDTYTDNGTAIKRTAIFPPVSAGPVRAVIDELHLDFQPGQGIATGQGSDPEAVLEWTDDGGVTWSNELVRGIGQGGDFQKVAKYARLGMFRTRSLRVSVSDPIKAILMSASIRLRGLGQ